jgi:phosphatidylinositol-3-phosphatase
MGDSRLPWIPWLRPSGRRNNSLRRALAKLSGLDPTRLDLSLPRPWVCVVLVLAFFGFGVFIGKVAPMSDDTLAASVRPQLRLVLPQTPAVSSPQATAPNIPAATSTPTSTPASEAPEASETSPQEGSESSSQSSKSQSSKKHGSSKSGGKKPAGGKSESSESSSAGTASNLPPIKHVFLIMLADQPYSAVFGPASSAPYIAKTLERRGELLVRYYAVTHDELANGIALVSGQGPTPQTEVNCPTYADIAPATVGAEGQVMGQGCVYPAATETLPGQLTAKHLTWKAYIEGTNRSASSTSGGCEHPAAGAADPTINPTAPLPSTTGLAADRVPPAYEAASGEEYATFRNPFVYFHSIIDSPRCAQNEVGLTHLAPDLSNPAHTPSLSYIIPSLCDDGDPTACAPGRPSGLAPADGFLRKIVPQILASKAYKQGGLLVISVDQAPSTGADADSSSCCTQPLFPNLPAPAPLPGGGEPPASGGGQVGALLLSPYVKPNTTNQETFNHFSLLRSIEDLFGLKHLGYAALPKLEGFGMSVFNGAGP